MKNKTMQRAFTLIELMVVVIIVAILAAAAVPIYTSMTGRAYETEILTGLAAVERANQLYRVEHGDYADSKSDLEDAGLLLEADFDGTYTEYSEFDLGEGAGEYKWTGSIDGYSFGEVVLGADGKVTRGNGEDG